MGTSSDKFRKISSQLLARSLKNQPEFISLGYSVRTLEGKLDAEAWEKKLSEHNFKLAGTEDIYAYFQTFMDFARRGDLQDSAAVHFINRMPKKTGAFITRTTLRFSDDFSSYQLENPSAFGNLSIEYNSPPYMGWTLPLSEMLQKREGRKYLIDIFSPEVPRNMESVLTLLCGRSPEDTKVQILSKNSLIEAGTPNHYRVCIYYLKKGTVIALEPDSIKAKAFGVIPIVQEDQTVNFNLMDYLDSKDDEL